MKLCTFRDVSIKGELYSREFNQHFRADNDMFTQRGQGWQFQPQHRRCFTRQLVQTKERRVYAIIGNADKQTNSRYSVVSQKKIRDGRMLYHGFVVLLSH